MKNLAKLFAFLSGFIFFMLASASGLDESKVKELISKVENANNNYDLKVIESVLSDEVSVTMHVPQKSGNLVIGKSKKEYLEILQQNWRAYESQVFSVLDLTIDISGDRAFVFSKVKEVIQLQNKKVIRYSDQEITLKVIDGALLVTSIIGYIKPN